MSTWLGSLFGSARPAGPTVEQEARQVSSEVDATVGELQQQYEDQSDIITQLGANVKRFHAAGKTKEAGRTFREMQQLQKRQDILAGKIETLSVVNGNVSDMYANVAVHGAMVKANSASARIGKELQVETVDATMDEAIEHKTAHDEVSMALAGGGLLDIVDPDELASDMELFIAQQQHVTSSSSAAPPMTKNEQSAYRARQLEDDEEVSRILDSMPAPRTQAPLTLAQRSVLAQNQRARKGGSTVTTKK